MGKSTVLLVMLFIVSGAVAQTSPSDPRTATKNINKSPKGIAEEDRERLQGTWSVTKTIMNGKTIEDRGLSGAKFAFRGDELSIGGHGAKERHTFKLDTVADTRAIFTNRIEPKNPQSGWMIYELKGDRLKLGFNDALIGRPVDFTPQDKLVVLELERDTNTTKTIVTDGGSVVIACSISGKTLYGYSITTGVWESLSIANPDNILLNPVVEDGVACVAIGRIIHAFSSSTGRWATLELPSVGEAKISGGRIRVDYGTKIYIFTGNTGKWAAVELLEDK